MSVPPLTIKPVNNAGAHAAQAADRDSRKGQSGAHEDSEEQEIREILQEYEEHITIVDELCESESEIAVEDDGAITGVYLLNEVSLSHQLSAYFEENNKTLLDFSEELETPILNKIDDHFSELGWYIQLYSNGDAEFVNEDGRELDENDKTHPLFDELPEWGKEWLAKNGIIDGYEPSERAHENRKDDAVQTMSDDGSSVDPTHPHMPQSTARLNPERFYAINQHQLKPHRKP
ncbi:hypothetical protein CS022_20825 [Veronia nyctiphanis]|uniref:Uncharacterized protein n=1 Tax=Veronia nyctiphanis TaxID=1278244 RepID=A0A4Q0YL76_9GAMM|nr:hypothetical protein [Veronia nyctiphanis]RXJ71532.1 hypothetical protein CS022_20825 [Veronia nyctiphanis]